MTREQCNYTITGLKAVFPVALATACPIGRIRNYMQRSLDHVRALLKIGRNGDFSVIPSLRKLYKSHRRSELINLGLESDVQRRQRSAWGSIAHARLKSPVEVASACAAAAAATVAVATAATAGGVDGEFPDVRAVAALREARALAATTAAALEALLEREALAGGDSVVFFLLLRTVF